VRAAVLNSPGSHGWVGAGYGARASWLAVSSAGWTAVLAATDPRTAADPSFVRVAECAHST
jgi:hypothetical protein